ncbi:uncharacterized protein [Panulirus ornatus]
MATSLDGIPAPQVTVTPLSNTSLTVSWVLEDSVKYDILRYVVQASTISYPPQQLECLSRPALSMQCELRDLTPYGKYKVAVQACDKVGCGARAVLVASTASTSADAASSSSSNASFTLVFLVFLFMLLVTCLAANYDIFCLLRKNDCMGGRFRRLLDRGNTRFRNLGRAQTPQEEPLRLRSMRSTVIAAPSDEIVPAELSAPPRAGNGAPAAAAGGTAAATLSDSPPPYHTVHPAGSCNVGLLYVEVHSQSQVASPQCDDKQMASPQCEDKPISAPQCDNRQVVSPQCDDKEMISPQCEDRRTSTPQCDNKQVASPQCEDKDLVSPQCEDRRTSSPQCDDKQVVSPQCDDKQVVSPQCDGKPVASPQCDGKAAPSPQCDDKQVTSPQCDDKQVVSPQCDEKEMFGCDNPAFS